MGSTGTTLRTIADELGLSVTAVSRALKGEKNISRETTERVREAARRLNYQPNAIAKSLRVNRTKTLGLVISGSSSLSFYGSLIEGIEKIAARRGYNIILSTAGSDTAKEKEAVQILASKRIDGLLLAASLLTSESDKEFLDSFGIPYLFLVRRPGYEDADYVTNDNNFGTFQMIDYLIKTGSRDIRFINIPKQITTSGYRLAGYMEALQVNGIAFKENNVCYAEPSINGGCEAMGRLIDDGGNFDTVFCGCDMIAVGAMERALECGCTIPGDIRLASYDDIELSAHLRVPLTTVRQPKDKIGETGAELLINKIENESKERIHALIKPELVLRKST